MGYYLNGRFLGNTPGAAVSKLSDCDVYDMTYEYITGYFDINDVAETIASDRVQAENWMEDALRNVREYAESGCPSDFEGITWVDDGPSGSKSVKRGPKSTASGGKSGRAPSKKAPGKKAPARRRC